MKLLIELKLNIIFNNIGLSLEIFLLCYIVNIVEQRCVFFCSVYGWEWGQDDNTGRRPYLDILIRNNTRNKEATPLLNNTYDITQ